MINPNASFVADSDRRPSPVLARRGLPVLLILALGGCKTVQFGPETAGPADTTSVPQEAALSLSNLREVDPGPLTFLFYPPTVHDIETVTPSRTFGPVDFEKSMEIKIPKGRWKVGYRLQETGDLHAMPSSQEEATDAEWPVIDLVGGKAYQLIIETDDGGNTIWRTNLPVQPPGP